MTVAACHAVARSSSIPGVPPGARHSLDCDALGGGGEMSFVEVFFLFFLTFLCPADWGEGDQIKEPYYDHLCWSGTEYRHVKKTLLLLQWWLLRAACSVLF